MIKPTYLGDGLYATFENWQVKLMANSPAEPTDVVYLEYPHVFDALVAFVKRAAQQGHEPDAGVLAASQSKQA